MRKLNAIAPVFLAAFLASCATAPRLPAPAPDADVTLPPVLSALPAGGTVYLWADTVTSRPLLDVLTFRGVSGADMAMILDRTASVAAVVFEQGEERSFFLTAAGRYPRRRANFALAFSRGWQRQRGEGRRTYWYSRNGDFAMSLGRRVALVSDRDPFESLPRAVPPQAFAQFQQGMALAGWVDNPSEPISGFLTVMGVPIMIPAEDLFFGAVRTPISPQAEANAALWDIALRLRTPSQAHARSLFALFSTARFFILQGAGAGEVMEEGSLSLHEAAQLLFANVPEVDGEFLTFRITSLDENRIALLFHIFSVYSSH